jgi:hypothetical protein
VRSGELRAVAGLDHDAASASGAVNSASTAGRSHSLRPPTNRAAAAEQRRRRLSIGRDGSVAELIAIQAGEREGSRASSTEARMIAGALAHKTGVGTEDQNDRALGIRARDECVDFGGFKSDRGRHFAIL